MLSLDSRIAKNSVALLFSSFANKITGFLIMLSVARFLGASRFGLYTYIYAYVAAFSLVTDLGLTTVVIRGITHNDGEGRTFLGTALLIRYSVTLAAYVCSVGCALAFYGWSERTWLIALFSVSFLSSPLTTYSAIFHARMLLYGPALASLLSRIVLLAAVQWIARSGGSIAALISAELVTGLTMSLGLWAWSRSLLRPKFNLDLNVAGRMLRESIPLFMSSVFITFYFRIDVFFLGHYRNDSVIGIYAAAYRLTEALPIIASALTNSIFPVLCQQIHEGNVAGTLRLMRTSLKMLLMAILPLSLIIASYSNLVIHILYGARFEGSQVLLSVLAWGQVVLFSNMLLSSLLIARGRSRSLMFITLGMLGLNILLNFWAIPRYGALGAALTTVGTELAGCLACLAATSMTRMFAESVAHMLLPVLVCGLVLACFGRKNPPWNLLSLWPMGAIAILYPASLVVFRVFTKEEWQRLRKLVWL